MSVQEDCKNCGATAPLSEGLCQKCQSVFAATIAPETPTSPPESPRAVPAEFGDYEILSEVARGGMGVIYKARHRKLNRVAALKMILGGQFSSPEELQRFHIEAEAAAKLDHPGIVPVYEIGEANGQPFFAMKFIEGGSLADAIERFRTQPKQAVELLAKVARAVHHAHQRGVLHRDLKPANILIDEDGEPLITDLGLAKNSAGDSNLTNTGAVLGTPSYMPPEQASGSDTVTTAVDVYSLGAIMYELLSGEPPYKGSTAIETVMRVLEGPPEPPSRKFNGVDRELELICLKCLEREPNQRYSSAMALAEDLDAWLCGDPISVRAPSVIARTRRWMRANKSVVYLLGGLLLTVLFALPFALQIAMGDRFASVYDRFPESERPLIFAIGAKTPQWVAFGSALFLSLVLWPSAGWLFARVGKPTSVMQAARTGAMICLSILAAFMLLIGWLAAVQWVSQDSRGKVQVLAEAVWAEEDSGGSKLEAANSLFKGLDEIPVSERADVVATRIQSDQVAFAANAIGNFLAVMFMLTVPVIFGTVYGYMLQKRSQTIFLSFPRYYAAWWVTTGASMLLLGWLTGNGRMQGGQPFRFAFASIASAVCLFIAWLIVRQWRRSPAAGSLPSSQIPARA